MISSMVWRSGVHIIVGCDEWSEILTLLNT